MSSALNWGSRPQTEVLKKLDPHFKTDDRRKEPRSFEEERSIRYFTPGALPKKTYSFFSDMAKRSLDMLGAIVALIVFAPIMLISALLVKLTSKGPIIFTQVRVGKGGKVFKMYKFRTMVVNAESLKDQLMTQNDMSGPVFKMKKDPRITKVGRFLRKFSFDELPQLFNVLKGDMSLVGPRPPLPKEVKKYLKWQTRRLSVKPGITCIWQVSGRNQIEFEDWVRMDLRYIDNRSFSLDFKILLKTIKVVLIRPDGA